MLERLLRQVFAQVAPRARHRAHVVGDDRLAVVADGGAPPAAEDARGGGGADRADGARHAGAEEGGDGGGEGRVHPQARERVRHANGGGGARRRAGGGARVREDAREQGPPGRLGRLAPRAGLGLLRVSAALALYSGALLFAQARPVFSASDAAPG